MKQNANLDSYLATAFLAVAFFFGLGCVYSPLPSAQVSSLDQMYRQQKMAPAQRDVNSSVVFYRDFVSKTLYSKCKWFPSDSVYTSIAQNRCGSVQGTLMGFARFMKEEDAASMGYPVMNTSGRLQFVDMPNECTF